MKSQIVVIDPRPAPNKWGTLPYVPMDPEGTYTRIEQILLSLLTELYRRARLMSEGRYGYKKLHIVIESFHVVSDRCPEAVKSLLDRLMRMGEGSGVALFLSAPATGNGIDSLEPWVSRENFQAVQIDRRNGAATLLTADVERESYTVELPYLFELVDDILSARWWHYGEGVFALERKRTQDDLLLGLLEGYEKVREVRDESSDTIF